MKQFQFGLDAQTTPENEASFADRRDAIVAAIKPANIVEQILADELIHSGWEMESVRTHAEDAEAAPILDAAFNRASRNWQRSLKQLKALQSARASHLAHPSQHRDRFPLADLHKLPKRPRVETPAPGAQELQ